MLPPEAIQVIENTPSRVVILDPPNYSFGAWLLFMAVVVGGIAAFLFLRGFLPELSAILLLVFVALAAFGAYLMTSKRLISLSRSEGVLTVEKGTWGRSHLEATIPLERIRRADVQNIGYAHSIAIVMQSGEEFSLSDGSNRQGYSGAVDAMNDFLGGSR